MGTPESVPLATDPVPNRTAALASYSSIPNGLPPSFSSLFPPLPTSIMNFVQDQPSKIGSKVGLIFSLF